MKRGERMLLCLLAGSAFCMAAQAVTSESTGNPYQGIVERNVFALKAPAPPPDPEANKPPPPKIILTGITTILGNKRALMKLTPPAKPGEPAKEQSFTLGEGQRDGELEVLEIDEKAGTVKVNEYGTVVTLSFEANGVKGTPGPAPGALPGPPGFVPKPGANPFTPTAVGNAMARPLRLPSPTPTTVTAVPTAGGAAPAYPGGTPVYGGGTPVYGSAAPGLVAGGTAVSLGGSTAPQTSAAQAAAEAAGSQMTAEQRFLMVEAYRAKLKQQGLDRTMPPVPPTPLTSELNPDAAVNTGTAAPTTPTGPPLAPTIPRQY